MEWGDSQDGVVRQAKMEWEGRRKYHWGTAENVIGGQRKMVL